MGSALPKAVIRPDQVIIDSVRFDAFTENDLISHVRECLKSHSGGTIFTPNVDIMRQLRRPNLKRLVDNFDVVVADGVPITWAAKLSGKALPARVAGSSLIWSLSDMAAAGGFSIFIVGAAPGVGARALERLNHAYPDLKCKGVISPPWGFEMHRNSFELVVDDIVAANPDIVYLALGFPLQERLMSVLARRLPASWLLGCGGGIDMAAGLYPRAPTHIQRIGLEWLYRLYLEPTRLAKRYLVFGLPYAVRLLGWAIAARIRQRPNSTDRAFRRAR